MRILLGVHQFLPDFYTGTENLTFHTAQELIARGHDVRVFTGHADAGRVVESDYFDQYDYEGIAVDRYFYSRRDPLVARNVIESSFNNPRSSIGFRRSIETFSPDLVHFYHLQRLTGSVIDVCVEKSIPMVLSITDYWLVCPTQQLFLPDNSICPGPCDPPGNCLKHLCMTSGPALLQKITEMIPERFLRYLMIRIDKSNSTSKPASMVSALGKRKEFLSRRMERVSSVLTATRFMGNILLEWGIHPSKIIHLPFGIAGILPLHVPEKQIIKTLRIGFIGSLSEHKGAHLLIQAAASTPKDMQIAVKIYGDPKPFPRYAKKLRRLIGKDPRIELCGVFPPHNLGRIFQEMDLLVVPSLWHENTPLVIHSALSARVPVVASDVNGVKEVIRHGENGLLFERGDIRKLREMLINLYQNRSWLMELTGNCQPIGSLKEYVDRLEQLYKKALESQR